MGMVYSFLVWRWMDHKSVEFDDIKLNTKKYRYTYRDTARYLTDHWGSVFLSHRVVIVSEVHLIFVKVIHVLVISAAASDTYDKVNCEGGQRQRRHEPIIQNATERLTKKENSINPGVRLQKLSRSFRQRMPRASW